MRTHSPVLQWLRRFTGCIAVLSVAGLASAQTPFKHQGIDLLHPADSAMPNEQVDPASGTLTVVATDLVVPGNAGFNLAVRRVYNSSIFPDYDTGGSTALEEDSWAGIGWKLHFGRILHADSTSAGVMQIEMGDGSRHALYHSLGNPNIWATSDFWLYNPATHVLQLPNGRVYTFDREVTLNERLGVVRYVTEIRDTFQNRITFSYFDVNGPADGVAGIQQYLSATQVRNISFTYNATLKSLATMTYLTHTWTYDQVSAGPAGHSLLTVAHPPQGPSTDYEYGFAAGLEMRVIHAPFGGQISYSYVDAARRAGALTTTARVVATRTMTGHDVTTGTWNFAYSTGSNLDTTVITNPCGGVTKYRFNGTGVSEDFTAWKAGTLAEMTMGDGIATLEQRTMTWVRSEPISSDPVSGPNGVWSDDAVYRPLLGQQTTTRGTHSWTTNFTYHTGQGNFNDYGNPYFVEEMGESIYQWRRTTRTFQSGFTPYLLGVVASETVSQNSAFGQHDGSTMSSSTYNLSTGFVESQTVRGITTAFQAWADGNVRTATATVDGQQSRTTFTYNWGRASSVQTPKVTTTYVVSPDGLIQSQTQGELTTSYVYDTAMRLREVHPPAANAVLYTPDDLHGSWLRVNRGSSEVMHMVDGFGREIASYNSVGLRVEKVRDACGRVRFTADPFVTASATQGTAVQYDALGRVTRVTNSAGKVTTMTYEGAGSSRTDANNHVTVLDSMAFGDPSNGRLVGVTDALGHTTSYRYDVTGAISRVSGPEPGLQRTWVIGANGLADSETQPESGTTIYTYDQSGNVKTVTDANGQTTTFSYDENGRLKLRDAPGTDDDLAVTYDTTGRVKTLSSGVSPTISTTTFTYDVPNRKVTKSDYRQSSSTWDATFHSIYTSDANDNLVTLRYPSGRVVTYEYDGENRLKLVKQTPPGSTVTTDFAHTFTYGDRGQLESYVTGAVTQRFEIEFNRPKRIWTTGGAGALDLTYGYDDVGNVRMITDPRPGASQTFTLDPLDRLSTADGPWGSLAWTYDAAGNRLTESAPAMTQYNYTAATQRLMSTSGAAIESFSYDNVGQLTSDAKASYAYSPTGKLRTATLSGPGIAANYVYDAAGERLSTTINGQMTYTLRSLGGDVLTEYAWPCAGFVWSKDVVYAMGRPIGAVKATAVARTVTMGSPTATASESAASATVPIRLTISNGLPLACPVTVSYRTTPLTATEGADYRAATGTVTFPAGTMSGATQSAVVPLLDDPTLEGDQTFAIDLSGATGATIGAAARTTMTIRDNDPVVTVDAPVVNTPFMWTIAAAGWAVDPTMDTGTGIYATRLEARPAAGGATTVIGSMAYGGARPDVGALLGARFTNSGYGGSVYTRLRPGEYDLTVTALRVVTFQFDVSSSPVRVKTTALAIDSPAPGAQTNWTFPVNGWALNPAAASGTGVTSVTVRALNPSTGAPVQTVTATYGLDRGDVAAAYGSSQFQYCGYSASLTLSPGVYVVEVISNDAAGQIETLQRTVTVANSQTVTSVDTPVNNATVTSPFLIGGWAIDTGSPSGTGVDMLHVWAFKNGDGNQATFVGSATYGGSRPDVGAIYGSQFTNSGYNINATLTPGTYQLSIYTHSTVTNTFTLLTVVWVTVQ